RRREADEGGERNEEHVERIDEELLVQHQQGSVGDHAELERGGRGKREKACRDVDRRRNPAVADEGEDGGADERDAEAGEDLEHTRFSRGIETASNAPNLKFVVPAKARSRARAPQRRSMKDTGACRNTAVASTGRPARYG